MIFITMKQEKTMDKKKETVEKCLSCGWKLVERPSLGFGSQSQKCCPNPDCPSKRKDAGWGA